MSLLARLRRSALAAATLLVCLSGPAAVADDKLYEGILLSEDFGGPIKVEVELRDLHGLLVGYVKAGSPLSGTASIISGNMDGDKCDFRAAFNANTVMRLFGTCKTSFFEGRYQIIGRRDGGARGNFRLTQKEPPKEEEKRETLRNAVPATSLTECITANTRCLSMCPQGDYNSEFLCSNRCRSRYKACKEKTKALN